MFKKIQNKFLAAFILCVTITLIVTIFVGYRKANSVYQNLNDSITNAEYSKIAGDIENSLTEITKVLDSEIVPSLSFVKHLNQDRLSSLERIEAVQALKKKANIIISYPGVESLYIILNDHELLVFSKDHARTLNTDRDETIPESILLATKEPSSKYSILGNTRSSCFPLDEDNNIYLTLCRKMTSVYGSAVVILNLNEDVICRSYTDYLSDGITDIVVIDENRMIISSVEKTKIGKKLSDIDKIEENDKKIVSSVSVNEYGLRVVGAIPKTVFASELRPILITVVTSFIICMIGVSLFFLLWIKRRLKPLSELQVSMKKAGSGDYSEMLIPVGNDELTAITADYNTMLKDLDMLEQSKIAQEKELLELEMAALRNEINPHFLYNTLNTIKCMADIEGNEDVARCTVALGGIVGSLYKIKKPCWMIAEEVKLVEKYIDIMNIRYGDGIILKIQIPEEHFEKIIPKFILQPVIENAILHGFENTAFHGTIMLRVTDEKEKLIIYVEDDGCGMSDEKLTEMNEVMSSGKEIDRVGLRNVNRRIALRCGKQYGISFDKSELGGLRVKVSLPNTRRDYE